WRVLEFPPLGALDIGVEDETPLVGALAEDHPDIGKAVLIDGGERHRLGIVDFRRSRLGEPKLEQGEGIASLGKVGRAQIVQDRPRSSRERARPYRGPSGLGNRGRILRPCAAPDKGPNGERRHWLL